MIAAVLQVRVSSSRLPHKVLKPILGKPMLLRQVERIRRARNVDQLIIATSTDATDDVIVQLCHENELECFRGSLNDVLDRYYCAASLLQATHIVRLTGDCPLIDPDLIDQIIHFHLQNHFDYTSNVIDYTYPDGLDTEVLSYNCLQTVWKEAHLPSQREHVTSYIFQNLEQFRLGSYKNKTDLSHLRWTVDESLDLELISQIYEALYPINPDFSTQDILCLLEQQPNLKTWNKDYQRNEGYLKSLQKDAQLLSTQQPQ